MELYVFLSVFGLAALVAGIWACVQIHKDRPVEEGNRLTVLVR